jgi:hypothetical protein
MNTTADQIRSNVREQLDAFPDTALSPLFTFAARSDGSAAICNDPGIIHDILQSTIVVGAIDVVCPETKTMDGFELSIEIGSMPLLREWVSRMRGLRKTSRLFRVPAGMPLVVRINRRRACEHEALSANVQIQGFHVGAQAEEIAASHPNVMSFTHALLSISNSGDLGPMRHASTTESVFLESKAACSTLKAWADLWASTLKLDRGDVQHYGMALGFFMGTGLFSANEAVVLAEEAERVAVERFKRNHPR